MKSCRNDNKNKIILIAAISIGCLIMSFIDGYIQPVYTIKSVVKIFLFIGLPMTYSLYNKELSLKRLFIPKKGGFKKSLILGLVVYISIILAYFIFRNIFDFSAITKSLTGNIGVTKDNFIFVAIYISFINSLLEEFFFRGFAFLSLKKYTSRCFAYFFSSLSFALYHVCMISGWFSFAAFVLTILGLAIGGAIFNYLNEIANTIYPSWLVHVSANFAINTIGLILFGII